MELDLITFAGQTCLYVYVLHVGVCKLKKVNHKQFFSRNPDGESQPWCFIRYKTKLRFNDCNVTRCPEPGTHPPYLLFSFSLHACFFSNILSILTAPTSNVLKTEDTKPTVKAEFSVCGKPWPSRITSRIFGGRKSKPGAHPWQVSIQVRSINTTEDFSHNCGGILLNSCWVLTAAHCM